MEPAEIQARAAIAAALIVTRAVEVPSIPTRGDCSPDSAALRLRDLTDYVYQMITSPPPRWSGAPWRRSGTTDHRGGVMMAISHTDPHRLHAKYRVMEVSSLSTTSGAPQRGHRSALWPDCRASSALMGFLAASAQRGVSAERAPLGGSLEFPGPFSCGWIAGTVRPVAEIQHHLPDALPKQELSLPVLLKSSAIAVPLWHPARVLRSHGTW
jgi:hypothetical protein